MRLLFVVLFICLNVISSAAQAKPSLDEQVEISTLDLIVRSYQLFAQDAEGFDQQFLAKLKTSDRRELLPLLKGIKQFPTLQRKGVSLLITQADGKTLEMRHDLKVKNRFFVNGQAWLINPNKPLRAQVDLLAQKLELLDKGKSAWFPLLLPPALAEDAKISAAAKVGKWLYSQGGVILGIGVGATYEGAKGIVVEKWYSYQCDAFVNPQPGVNLPDAPDSCTDYIEKKQKSREMTQGEAPNPSKIRLSQGEKEKVEKLYNNVIYVCPTNDDGKPRILYARVCSTDPEERLKCKVGMDGNPIWRRVYNVQEGGTLENINGKMKSLWVLPDGVNPLEKNAEMKAVENFVFDPKTGAFMGVKVLKPVLDGGLTEVPTRTITKSSSSLDDQERFKNAQALLSWVTAKSIKCDKTEEKKEVEQANQGIVMPQKPVTNDPESGASVEETQSRQVKEVKAVQ